MQRCEILTDILKSETAEACQDTNFYENLQKKMRIYLLMSLLQILTIL